MSSLNNIISIFILNTILFINYGNALPNPQLPERAVQKSIQNELFSPSQSTPPVDSQYNHQQQQLYAYENNGDSRDKNYQTSVLTNPSSSSSGEISIEEPYQNYDTSQQQLQLQNILQQQQQQQLQQQQQPPQYYYDNVQNKVFTYGADGQPIIVEPITANNYQPPPYVISQPGEDGSYVIQTGYGGYAAPVTSPAQIAALSPAQSIGSQPALATQIAQSTSQFTSALTEIPVIGSFINTLSSLLPVGTFRFLMNTGNMIISILTMVLFGGALTTAICTFTPLCTISFAASALPLLGLLGLRDTSSLSEKIGIDLTTDRVQRAVDLVRKAIEKYQNVQVNRDGDDHSSHDDNTPLLEQ